MIHDLKIEMRWLHRILSGEKTFEIRRNYRDYQVGDTIHFIPEDSEDIVTINNLTDYRIVYIHSGFGMLDDYVVLGITKEIKGEQQ